MCGLNTAKEKFIYAQILVSESHILGIYRGTAHNVTHHDIEHPYRELNRGHWTICHFVLLGTLIEPTGEFVICWRRAGRNAFLEEGPVEAVLVVSYVSRDQIMTYHERVCGPFSSNVFLWTQDTRLQCTMCIGQKGRWNMIATLGIELPTFQAKAQ